MSEIVIGALATSGNKILSSQSFTKELNGLVQLTEVYIVRGQDLASLTPANGTLHSAYSTATTKYSTLSVERASASTALGGLAEIAVEFVGIIGSLPPAIVRVIPVEGAGIFGPPVNIEAEFVTDSTENDIAQGRFGQGSPQLGIIGVKIMPAFINGTRMPDHPRQPYVNDRFGGGATILERYFGYCLKNVDSIRRGRYLVCRAVFQESSAFNVIG